MLWPQTVGWAVRVAQSWPRCLGLDATHGPRGALQSRVWVLVPSTQRKGNLPPFYPEEKGKVA